MITGSPAWKPQAMLALVTTSSSASSSPRRQAPSPSPMSVANATRATRRVSRTALVRRRLGYETFLVRAGEYEAVYGNMPPHGLGRPSEVVPIGSDSSARGRLKRAAG